MSSVSVPLEDVPETTNLFPAFIAETIFESNSDNFENKLFYHISTDEVFGSLGKDGLFTEESAYNPQSPYSASKASSDHFVRAFGSTYNLSLIHI